MKNINFAATGNAIGLLPPMYQGYGRLDDHRGFDRLSDKNKYIIESLSHILTAKGEGENGLLYVADRGITSLPKNQGYNESQMTIFNGILQKELDQLFTIKRISDTELRNLMPEFYGLESHDLTKDQLRNYLRQKHNYCVKTLQQFLDENYEGDTIYTPVHMNNLLKRNKLIELVKQ